MVTQKTSDAAVGEVRVNLTAGVAAKGVGCDGLCAG